MNKLIFLLWEVVFSISNFIIIILILWQFSNLTNENYLLLLLASFMFEFSEICRILFYKDYINE